MSYMNDYMLQAAINIHSDSKVLKVDGEFGPRSMKAARLLLENNGVKLGPKADVKIALMQFVLKEAEVATGPIDGIDGPITARAADRWEGTNWRSDVQAMVPPDVTLPTSLQRWPKYNDIEEFYGKAGTNQILVNLPYPKRLAWDLNTQVTRLKMNKNCAESYIRVQNAILQAYGLKDLIRLRLDITGGMFNHRPMRGGKRLSTHAYGCAEDVDPVMNRLRETSATARLARPEYAEYWKCWTDEGWTSLGKAKNFDWMHVQACRL